MVAANARTAITFSLSPGQTGDGPEGRKLLASLGGPDRPMHLIMDRAYQGDETRQLAIDLGFTPVVPPLSTRINAWKYSRKFTSAEMKSSDSFGAGRHTVESSPDSKNSTQCSLRSFISP